MHLCLHLDVRARVGNACSLMYNILYVIYIYVYLIYTYISLQTQLFAPIFSFYSLNDSFLLDTLLILIVSV